MMLRLTPQRATRAGVVLWRALSDRVQPNGLRAGAPSGRRRGRVGQGQGAELGGAGRWRPGVHGVLDHPHGPESARAADRGLPQQLLRPPGEGAGRDGDLVQPGQAGPRAPAGNAGSGWRGPRCGRPARPPARGSADPRWSCGRPSRKKGIGVVTHALEQLHDGDTVLERRGPHFDVEHRLPPSCGRVAGRPRVTVGARPLPAKPPRHKPWRIRGLMARVPRTRCGWPGEVRRPCQDRSAATKCRYLAP